MEFSFDCYVNNSSGTYASFSIPFSLAVGGSSKVIFNIQTAFSAKGSVDYGYAEIKLASSGGTIPAGYGAGYAEVKLTSSGSGGFYIPPKRQYGFGFMPSFSSTGLIITSRKGDGSATIQLSSKGGIGGYGEGVTGYLPKFISFGEEGPGRLVATVYNEMYILDAITPVQNHLVFINEVGQIVDSITASKQLIEEILERLTLTCVITSLGTYNFPIFSSCDIADMETPTVLSGVIERPSLHTGGSVWVVNIETGATTQYDGYGFNDFFGTDNKYYGIADDGIYELTGKKDAGMGIPAEVDLGSFKFGSQTKIKEFYVGVSSKDEIYLKVTVGADTYTYKARSSSGYMENHRVDVGRGLKGMYWELVLQGEDFEMDLIEFSPINLRKRVK